MANEIDLVVGTQVKAQLDALIAHLGLVDAKLVETSRLAITLSKEIPKINTPTKGSDNGGANAGANKGLIEASALNKKLADQIDYLRLKVAELQKTRAGGTVTLLQETVALKEELRIATAAAKGIDLVAISKKKLEDQTKKTTAQLERSALAAEKEASAYNRTQAQLNKLTAVYNDLSVRKERYNNLTDNEEKRLVTLTRVNEKYNGVLRTTDAAIGKNTRNVGNYASGWNGLSNSINQLTREAPAFANSMQTGFMALSNNIPIFVDELENIRLKNVQLAKDGQKTQSVFSAVSGAFFSWQTALSVGVTLLTIYGAKLIDMAFNTDAAKKATEKLTQSLKDNQDQVDKNISALEHQANIDIELAKQRGASEEELAALRMKLGVNLLTENEKNNARLINQLDSFDRYRLLQAQGGNKALLFLLDKYNGNVNKARAEFQRREKAYTDENRKLLVDEQEKTYELVRKQNEKNTELDATNRTAAQERANEGSRTMNSDQQKAEEERLALLAEMHRKEIELELAKIDILLNDDTIYYTDRLHQLDLDFIKRSELEKVNADEELRLAGNSYEAQQVALLNSHIARIGLIDDYNKKKKKLEGLDLDPITQLATSDLEEKDPMKILEQNAKRGLKSLKGTTVNLKSTWKETFNSIAESAKQAGDIMAEFSDRNFQNEYARLEAQKDISLRFAGESAFAKEQISEQYDKKRREIEVRQNKAKQKQAIFEIAINTAQAIVATLAKTPLPAGLPFVIATGALGAAQIAAVAAQKIPQYFEGGTHGGGLMMVNDAKGSNYKETIVTPDGKIIKPEGRDVVMNAPKGTQIFTPEQWQEKELHNMLQSKGISMNESHHSNNGLTYQEMDAILGKHFKNITTQTTTFDKKGFSSYSVSKGNKTIRNENRASGQGFKV
jgi:hypothetical protein